ncbi:MAG: hypothetical protein PUD68_04055 [Clostridiales bacterium]|nr:hypothetical protein [Clostridiales bacterium]
MALVKCPRCDLNYILDGGTLCTVCRKEVKGEHDAVDTLEMCSECGEHPAVAGSDLCMFCLKEMNRRSSTNSDDSIGPESANIEIDSVSTMDEIELDIVDDDMASQFDAEGEFKDDEEEEEEEDGDVVSKEALAEDEDRDDDDEMDE